MHQRVILHDDKWMCKYILNEEISCLNNLKKIVNTKTFLLVKVRVTYVLNVVDVWYLNAQNIKIELFSYNTNNNI